MHFKIHIQQATYHTERLTNHEAQEFVRQETGSDEGHPQTNIEFLSDFGLHPHEQAETQTQCSATKMGS